MENQESVYPAAPGASPLAKVQIVDGKPRMTPAAMLYVAEQLTDEEAFEMSLYASEGDVAKYCERAAQWLFEHGKVSV